MYKIKDGIKSLDEISISVPVHHQINTMLLKFQSLDLSNNNLIEKPFLIVNKIKGVAPIDSINFEQLRLNRENLVKFQEYILSKDFDGLFKFLLDQPVPENSGLKHFLSTYVSEDADPVIFKLANTFLTYSFLTGGLNHEEFLNLILNLFHEYRLDSENIIYAINEDSSDTELILNDIKSQEVEDHSKIINDNSKNVAFKKLLLKVYKSPTLIVTTLGLTMSLLSMFSVLPTHLPMLMPLTKLITRKTLEDSDSRVRLRDIYDVLINKIHELIK